MSPRSTSFDMGLPPFRGAVRNIILASTAIYVALLLLQAFATPVADLAYSLGVLQPERIHQGWLWQFASYAFMYRDPLDFVLSLVGIYFIGGAVEDQVGSQRFYGLFFGSMGVGGGGGVFFFPFLGVVQKETDRGWAAAGAAPVGFFFLFI